MKKRDLVLTIIIGIFIVIILLCLVMKSVSKDGERVETTAEENGDSLDAEEVIWVEYPTEKWTVKYPSNWITDVETAENIITFAEPLQGTEDNFREYFSVCYLGTVEELGTVDEYLNNTLLPAIDRDVSVLAQDSAEEIRIETDDSVNKLYENARQIKLRCKMMSIDYQNAYKNYISPNEDVDTGIDTEDLSSIEDAIETVSVDTIESDVEEDFASAGSSSDGAGEKVILEAPDELIIHKADDAEAKQEELQTEEQPEEQSEEQLADDALSDSSNYSQIDALQPDGTSLYRTYTIIENGGYLYAFISCALDLDVDEYTETFDTALKSLNCLLGESVILDEERANNKTEIDISSIMSDVLNDDESDDKEVIEDVVEDRGDE